MTERKLIDGLFVEVGKPAPAGHEGRPYTKDLDTKKHEKKEPEK
jgi:hypothetical protein